MSILTAGAPDCFSLFKRSMIQSDDLPLTGIIDDQSIRDVFDDEKVDFGNAHEDVFTPAITLWAMISQFLFSGTGRSVEAAAGRVVSLYAQLEGRVVAKNAGNYCRARAKIPAVVIKKLARSLAHRAEYDASARENFRTPIEPDQAEDRLCPRAISTIRSQPVMGRIINVDGFTVDAPDTPKNQAKYPQNPAQAEGLGFPLLRCVGLISMTTGLLIDLAVAAYSGKGTGETSLLRQLRASLRSGDVLVADCYYCTYWLIVMCREIGVELVMKNHHKREDYPHDAHILNERERTAIWQRPQRPKWMSKKAYRKIPDSVTVRLCDFRPQQSESRCERFTVTTTMLDHESAPAEWIGAFYEGRWIVETDIRSLKCTMGIEHLRSQSPEGIERELWTGMLTYNLVRLKILQNALSAERDTRSLSFSETYQHLSTNWLLTACVSVSEPMAASSQQQGVCRIVGNRPDRVEPRENKRRPKTIKLMTTPRRLQRGVKAALS